MPFQAILLDNFYSFTNVPRSFFNLISYNKVLIIGFLSYLQNKSDRGLKERTILKEQTQGYTLDA